MVVCGGELHRQSECPKRQRNEKPRGRHLLMTLTNEPFQPVRLYYSIPSRAVVSRKQSTLECMMEAPEEHCWKWLFQVNQSGGVRYDRCRLVP